MSSPKEKEMLLMVIEMYRDMQYLWLKSHKEFYNKSLRAEGYRVLLEIYKNYDPMANIKTLKKKLLNMRTSYNKEYNKVIASEKKSSCAEDVYKPTLWYFDALSFISEQSQTPLDTMKSEEDSNSSDNEIFIQRSESAASTSRELAPPRRRKSTLQQNHEKIVKLTETLLTKDKKEEDWEIFGKCIGMQMKDLDKEQLVFTHKIISDVLYNAKLGRLSEDSCLLVTSSYK